MFLTLRKQSTTFLVSASDAKCLLSELKSSCSTVDDADATAGCWLDDRRNLLENPPKPDEDLGVLLAEEVLLLS